MNVCGHVIISLLTDLVCRLLLFYPTNPVLPDCFFREAKLLQFDGFLCTSFGEFELLALERVLYATAECVFYQIFLLA